MRHIVLILTHILLCLTMVLSYRPSLYSYSSSISIATFNPAYNPPELNLTSMCQPMDGVYMLRVKNNTNFDIEFVWERYGSGTLSEVLTSPANGEVIFWVSHSTNPTLKIYWDDDYTWDEGDTKSSPGVSSRTKATNSSPCSEDQEAQFNAEFGLLPVEWLLWEAKSKGKHVYLIWATASELNSSHFEVERSYDGREFTQIGRVESFGTTQDIQLYEFLDEQPLNGTAYYRLKQVDFDGSIDYTDIIEVRHQVSQQALSAQAYPSFTKGYFRLSTQLVEATPATLQLLSTSGQLVREYRLHTLEGYNEWEVLIDDLPNGMYYYILQHEDSKASGKVVKQ